MSERARPATIPTATSRSRAESEVRPASSSAGTAAPSPPTADTVTPGAAARGGASGPISSEMPWLQRKCSSACSPRYFDSSSRRKAHRSSTRDASSSASRSVRWPPPCRDSSGSRPARRRPALPRGRSTPRNAEPLRAIPRAGEGRPHRRPGSGRRSHFPDGRTRSDGGARAAPATRRSPRPQASRARAAPRVRRRRDTRRRAPPRAARRIGAGVPTRTSRFHREAAASGQNHEHRTRGRP